MTIKVKDDTKKYIKELKKYHGGLSIVSADTVNTAAKLVKRTYLRKLDSFTLRNKFTKGAVKIFFANVKRSKGGFRPIEKINAIVAVKKMKGGKQHYLQDQEEGDVKRGRGNTLNFVPIPTDEARRGGAHNKPIKGPLRLQRSTIQTLRVGGEPLGVPGSKFKPHQSFAILHKYMKNPKYGWDKSKQFFFTGIKGAFGVFKKFGSRFSMVRNLTKKSVKIKALHKFDHSFDKLSPSMMKNIFFRAADRFLRK